MAVLDAAIESMASDVDATAETDAATTSFDSGGDRPSVMGTVVDFVTTRPFAGRTVFISGHVSITDAVGNFSLPAVDVPYDAIVGDPDGSTLSIYRGLTRRDPVLPHMGIATVSNRALLNGDVSGGGQYPLAGSDSVQIYFFSPQADNLSLIGGRLPVGMTGPGYGPLPLAWQGPDSISGQLVALGTFYGTNGGAVGAPSSWFAAQPLTLAKDQTAFVNLALAPIPQSGHIAGTIVVPANHQIVQKEIFYRLPIVHASLVFLGGSGSLGSFDDVVPDLGYAGAELCVGAAATPESFLTQRCGVALGTTDLSVTLQAPPALSAPSKGATVARDTRFSWTAFENGIHMLVLQASAPSASTPQMYLFTSDTSTAWPDLSPLGVVFPVGAGYQCSIEGLGPYPSIDDALGPNGIGALFPAELRRSLSTPIQVTTSR